MTLGAFILLLFLVFVQFYPFFFGQTLVFGDNFSLMVPGKIFTSEWIKRGVLPLWNPYIFSGLPWIQDVNQSVLYPSTVLFVLLPPAAALNITIITHVLFTGIGAWLLARRFISNPWLQLLPGVLWAFSTQVTGSIHNLSTIQSIAWLPWIVLIGTAVTRSHMAKFFFSFAVLFQFLGGYPQHVIYSLLATVLVNLFTLRELSFFDKQSLGVISKWLVSWSLVALLTLSITTFAWLPFAETLLSSTRMSQSFTQAQVGSLNPSMLAKVFLPYLFDKPTAGMKWGPAWSGQPNMVFYITIIGLLIIALRILSKKLTRIEKMFLVFIPISIIFSFGSSLPGFETIQKLIPFFRIGRYPSMILIVSNLFLALWVGIALESVKITKKMFILIILLVISLILLNIGIYVVATENFVVAWNLVDNFLHHKLSLSAFHTLEKDRIIFSVVITNVISVSVFLLFALFAFWKRSFGILLLVLALDMIIHTHGNFQFASVATYNFNQEVLMEKIRSTDTDKSWQYRWLTRGSNRPYSDYGSYWEAMIVRRPFSDSFVNDQELDDFARLGNLRDGMVPNWNMVGGLPLVHGYTTLVPGDYAEIWQKPNSETRINFLDEIDPLESEQLRLWSTKYYLVDTSYAVQEDLSSIPINQVIDHWQVFSLPGTLPRIRYRDGTEIIVKNYIESPNELTFEVDTETPQELLIADRYDKDWQAFVNGKSVVIENYAGQRLISIEKGNNQIKLQYSPRLFYLGVVVSFSTVTLFLILSVFKKVIWQRYQLTDRQ